MNMIAQISGQAAIHALVYLIIIGVCFWLLFWLISYIALPDPFAKIARVVIAIVAVLFLINLLLSLVGHPLIAW